MHTGENRVFKCGLQDPPSETETSLESITTRKMKNSDEKVKNNSVKEATVEIKQNSAPTHSWGAATRKSPQ